MNEWFDIKDVVPEKGSDIIVECINKVKREKIKETLDSGWYHSLDMYSTEYHVARYLGCGCYHVYNGIEIVEEKYNLIRWCRIFIPENNKVNIKIENKENKKYCSRFELMDI